MAPDGKKPTLNLTIYLAKTVYHSPTSLLKERENNLLNFRITSGGLAIGDLYVQTVTPRAPRWARYFRDHIDVRQLGKVSSSSAVLIVNTKGRLYAITFGQGRYLLLSECWEERFGLIVALNCVGENNVRSIDKRTFDAISRHSREQASRETSARDFGLDIERDLLRAVTGTPTDNAFGKRLYGMDALNVSASAEIEDIPNLLSSFHEKYLDISYKKNFPWVDQIAEVKNPGVRDKLDSLLIERIRSKTFDRIWMAVPEVVPWEKVAEFRFAFGSRAPGHTDIHLDAFIESLDDPASLEKHTLLHRYVHCIDIDGITIDKWQAYRCLYAELDHEGDSFLLSGGNWYRVARDFVDEVNRYYDQIPVYRANLPEYNDPSETAYNERVAISDVSRFALMDRKVISHGGGYGQVEFCDLYTSDKDLIHIKRYGGSSVLSHLFSQGLVSGELFQTDRSFRQKVNDHLLPPFKLDDCSKRPESREYQVVFAVVSDAPGDLVLPFFSRLNLKHAVRRLEGYGYRVARAKIPVKDTLARLKKY